MGFLRSFRGALLVISHDLELLDQAITRVLHLDKRGAHRIQGHLFAVPRAAKVGRGTSRQDRDAPRAEIRRLSTLADSMRHQTSKRARIAKSLDKRVEKLEGSKVERLKRDQSMRVKLPDPPHAGRTVLEVVDLAKAFGPKVVFEDVTFDVERGSRLLVLGLNGAGKTTLLRSIVGELEPELGEVQLGHEVSMGYYAQEHEGITRGRSVIEHVREEAARPDQYVRNLSGCSACGASSRSRTRARSRAARRPSSRSRCSSPASTTSCCSTSRPTTSIRRRATAIGAALREWKGAMVLVSHDVEFVAELAPDKVLLMPDGVVDYWSEDLIDLVALA